MLEEHVISRVTCISLSARIYSVEWAVPVPHAQPHWSALSLFPARGIF